MFRNCINRTPLVSDDANVFFDNIEVTDFRGDVTFSTTLRALVYPRMKNDDRIILRFTSSSYSENDINRYGRTRATNMFVNESVVHGDAHGAIFIHSFSSAISEHNAASFDCVQSNFTQLYEGWHLLEKVTEFFKKSFRVLCYINPECKNVYLFVDSLDMQRMHYLQCAIFAFLPWYFDQSKGVSELEMRLIKSLREKSSDEYEACIAEIASKYDFRNLRVKRLLAGFESRYEMSECESLRRNINGRIDTIRRLNAQIVDVMKTKAAEEERLMGLETKIAQGSGESEIMDYFLCNNSLAVEYVEGTQLVFTCKTYLEYFNEDIANSVIDNDLSYVYRPGGTTNASRYIAQDDIRRLMTAIFIDQTLRIKVCAAYELDIYGSASAMGGYAFGPEFRDYLPNTHINNFRCLGSYQSTINRLLQDHNYIGAIEQCVASCKSLNFGDSPVMSTFMRQVYGIDCPPRRFIELPNGSVVTPKDAIAWLKKDDKEEDEDE